MGLLLSIIDFLDDFGRSRPVWAAASGLAAGDSTVTVLTPGTQLGPYKIEGRLGIGGMGEVFRAVDTRLGRPVAIKISQERFSERFEREVRAISALNHPNICTLYDIGESYLVMELVEGETLAARLEKGKLSIGETVRYGSQIADALAEAHSKGITHRDLKPGNVMLAKNGVKVLDFGLARSETDDTLTAAHAMMGTPAYMAPEHEGRPADAGADLFALGLVLYEMAAGQRPFPVAPAGSRVAKGETAPALSSFAKVPVELNTVVARLLLRNPSDRIPSARAVAETLAALTTNLSAKPDGLVSRRLWPAIITAILGLFVAALWFGRHSQPANLRIEQVTSYPDSAVEPSFSSDGRMLAFIPGRSSALAGTGEVYVKVVPGGEPVELTHDNQRKMDPVFSPDGSLVAYTISPDNSVWDTWQVPVVGGQPRLWFPNAEGLTWLDAGHILFSEIKMGIHMSLVSAANNRTNARDIYVPPDLRGMAHRSRRSPDQKWVLVATMDQYGWLPCRLVPFDASSLGREVGPRLGSCTHVAWSPDGRWMYFTSDASGTQQVWRQRFPDGKPEQLTLGPMEAEGIAVAPDGKSLISSIGVNQSSIWVSENGAERQVSGEGTARFPAFGDGFPTTVFSPGGKQLFYLVKNGPDVSFAGGELRMVDLAARTSEAYMPGFRVTSFDLSPDGRQIVFATISEDRHSRIWLAPVNRRSSPRELDTPDAIGPVFGPADNIYFRARDGEQYYVFEMNLKSMAIRKFNSDPAINAPTISPDRKWIISVVPATLADTTVVVSCPRRSPPLDFSRAQHPLPTPTCEAMFSGIYFDWIYRKGRSDSAALQAGLFGYLFGRTHAKRDRQSKAFLLSLIRR